VQKDVKQGAEWYQKAAALGNTFGMIGLGYCYGTGQGVEKDDRQAVEWYRKAAALGNPAGMSSLGYRYRDGLGVEKDDKQAVDWFNKNRRHAQPRRHVLPGLRLLDRWRGGEGRDAGG
jgi:hypothetical protein